VQRCGVSAMAMMHQLDAQRQWSMMLKADEERRSLGCPGNTKSVNTLVCTT
jgi:hypothetical protein